MYQFAALQKVKGSLQVTSNYGTSIVHLDALKSICQVDGSALVLETDGERGKCVCIACVCDVL